MSKEELEDCVKRLLVLSVDQRASIDALTLTILKLAEQFGGKEEGSTLSQDISDLIDEYHDEFFEERLIQMEDCHPAFAASLSEIADQMKEQMKQRPKPG